MQNNNNPLVSIGVPTYNRPEGLQRTLEEICKQTYQNLEIIVSDNCSTIGDAKSISKEFASNDIALHFYRQSTNIGAINNLNYVLSKANGKYFIWMADDDQNDTELIGTLVAALEKNNNAVLCGCDISIIDVKDKLIRTEYLSNLYSDISWGKIKRKFFMCPISNVFLSIYGMYRLNVLKYNQIYLEASPNNKSMGTEIPFLAKISLYGEIIAIPKTLKHYRIHDDSEFTLEQKSINNLDKFIVNLSIRYKLLRLAINPKNSFFEKMSLISAIGESAMLSILAKVLPNSIKEFIKRKM